MSLYSNSVTYHRCKNYELCETSTLSHNSLCKNCMSWGELSIETETRKHKCTLCEESVNTKIPFPSKCSHIYCIDCTRYLLFCDESSMFNISPIPYGCPPCPNGCRNPTEGNQCTCPEYEDVIVEWWKHNKDKAEEFIYACYVDGKNKTKEIKCPLCDQYKYSSLTEILFTVFIIYPQYLSKLLIES